MKRQIALIIVALAASYSSLGQYKMTNKEYAEKYSALAIKKMIEYKIPASITLAQGILESGAGGSRLAVKANNHFGIKCGSRWSGDRIYHDDDSRGECFRKYRSVEESYSDHSLFLTHNQRYATLFTLDITDYRAWAQGLKAAGYATNPQYPTLLIKLIEDNDLWRYDQQGAVAATRKPEGLLELVIEKNNATSSAKGLDGKLSTQKFNGVKYVTVSDGDTFETLSKKTGVSVKKLLEFNDLNETETLKDGMAVYVTRKKNKSKTNYMCEVERGETMHSISQRYGIKLKSLEKMNPDYRYKQPLPGTYIKLR